MFDFSRCLLVMTAVAVLLASCASAAPGADGETGMAAEPDPAGVSRAAWLTRDWNEIEAAAMGTTVHFYAWGGDPQINRWLQGYVANELQRRHNLRLQLVPMDTGDIVNKLVNELAAGRDPGSIDLMWVNGENFRTAREADALLGPVDEPLPNFRAYVDAGAPEFRYDFGMPVAGYEVPWGQGQFVMIYDQARVPDPPRSLVQLEDWVRRNPGRFTYPAPPDFTGSALLRTLLYDAVDGYEKYLQDELPSPELEARAEALWDILYQMKPYLWEQGRSYPSSLGRQHELFSTGEVWLTMAYGPNEAAQKVKSGLFPETTRTFVFESGTLANTHFLAVAANAANVPGALVAANFLLSPEAQLSKYDLNHWGDLPVLDPARAPESYRRQLAEWPRHEATLAPETLEAHKIPELPPFYVDRLEELWAQHVLRR
ncbi:MAG: ABC transporter substrate-binding protein [Thermaerobacterales bacterium]